MLQRYNSHGVTGTSRARRRPYAWPPITRLESRCFLSSITFGASIEYAVETHPLSLAAADLNDDGAVDLVAVNQVSGTLSVLLGNGDGTFAAAQSLAVGSQPRSIAIADFDGDSKLDLAAGNRASNDVSILPGNGDGTFQSGTTFAVGVGPWSIAAADLNADGALDLATANYDSDSVSVLLGNGDGTFQAHSTFAGAVGVSWIAVGDLDGDVMLDIVTANEGPDSVSVYLGNGDGTFLAAQEFSAGSDPRGVVTADVDGDGLSDVVASNYFSGDISVLLGNGDGTLQSQQVFAAGAGAISLAVADVNGDSSPDIVATSYLTNSVRVLEGNGDGTFQAEQSFDVGVWPHGVVIADFDGDGRPDIATANQISNSVSILLNETEFPNVPGGKLSGAVWLDLNNNGEFDFGESGIAGVEIRLSGIDDLNQPVSRVLHTDEDGVFIFEQLRAGTYSIEEVQPTGYTDGLDEVGSLGGSIATNDVFSDIPLGVDETGINYNLGERPLAGELVQPGQTATIGFWQNRNGQALIRAFDGGGASTRLGDWIAATLPNLFGSNAGPGNLAGTTNSQIAEAFRQRFMLKGIKVDAQVMASALSVYATVASLGGANAAVYGFMPTEAGLAASTFSVGANGAAFGVANGSIMTVLDLLQAADAHAVAGVLYGGNSVLRRMANDVFSAINEAGDI